MVVISNVSERGMPEIRCVLLDVDTTASINEIEKLNLSNQEIFLLTLRSLNLLSMH